MIEPKKILKDVEVYETEDYINNWEYKLDSNENNFGPSIKVLIGIARLKPKDICFYPSYGEAKEKIADYNNVKAKNILLTNGADEAISVIYNTYLEPKDAVLTVTPTFSMPKIYAKTIGAKYIEIDYKTKWEFPIEAFLYSITEQVKIIHLTTPNNPTGEVISKKNLEKIISKAKDKLILIDETYSGYSGITNAEYIKKYDNIFIVKSMSKDFGLAGLRIGYIVTQEENIKNLKKIISPYSVNGLATKAAITALEDQKYLENIKIAINDGKDRLINHFASLHLRAYPSEANFLLVDCGYKCYFIYKKLKNANIIVKKFNDPKLKSHLRITIGPKNSVDKIIDKLKYKPTIVFDMDGVLIDTSDSYRMAIKYTVEHYSNKTIELNKIQEIKNRGGLNNDWDLTEYILNEIGIVIEREEIIKTFQSYYWGENGDGLINNEKILIKKEVLEELSKSYHLCIFTGRPEKEANYSLKIFGIEKYFDKIITMNDLPKNQQKPSSLGLEKIYQETLTYKIYYAGDTIDDIKAGNNLANKGYNITTIGVLPPQDKSEDLRAALKKERAMIVLNDINEIESIWR